MKKLLLAFALLTAATAAYATHFSGGEIRYRPEGSKYRVELVLYNLCAPGIASMPSSGVVNFTSSCGASFTRPLPRVSIDTVTDAFCASVFPGCGGSYPATLVAVFSDTVSMPACASWKIWWESCCRSGSISNISSPTSANAYLEAFLNNSAAPNASALLANPPIQPLAPGSVSALYLQATDLQGDSIAYELIPARDNNGGTTPAPVSVPYAVGYSAMQPFGGTGTSLNPATGLLQATPQAMGQYSVNIRVKDYRQGVLVGYCERDWTVSVYGAANTVPLPASGTQFNYITCPGQAHTIALTFLDPGDSVYVTATPDAAVTWPVVVTGGVGVNSATTIISWTTPANLNVSATPSFYIRVKARDADCPVRGIAWYDILVRTAQCNTDSVWAGDADGNYVVDLYDPLAIAIAHGKTGPVRAGASTAWAAQWCSNWSTQFLNGVNHKHADCNGDGTVNSADLNAVTANYGQFHTRDNDAEQPKTAGLPDLYFDLTGINAVAGSTVTIPIKLGTTSSTMTGLYGLATRIQTQNVSFAQAPTVSYTASWLGTVSNTLRFARAAGTAGVDWAYARTTGTAMSGDGTLGSVTMNIPANTPVGTPLILRFQSARLIGPTGMVLTGYNVINDTITITAATTVGSTVSSVRDAFVVPNPSDRHALLQVNLDKAQTVHLSIADAVGRTVWAQPKTFISGGSAALSLSDVEVPAGMYFIHVQPADGSAGKVVKWIKK